MGHRRLNALPFVLALCLAACSGGLDWRTATSRTVTVMDLFCGTYGAVRPLVAPLAAPAPTSDPPTLTIPPPPKVAADAEAVAHSP